MRGLIKEKQADPTASVEQVTQHLLACEDPRQRDWSASNDRERTLWRIGHRSKGIDSGNLEREVRSAYPGKLSR